MAVEKQVDERCNKMEEALVQRAQSTFLRKLQEAEDKLNGSILAARRKAEDLEPRLQVVEKADVATFDFKIKDIAAVVKGGQQEILRMSTRFDEVEKSVNGMNIKLAARESVDDDIRAKIQGLDDTCNKRFNDAKRFTEEAEVRLQGTFNTAAEAGIGAAKAVEERTCLQLSNASKHIAETEDRMRQFTETEISKAKNGLGEDLRNTSEKLGSEIKALSDRSLRNRNEDHQRLADLMLATKTEFLNQVDMATKEANNYAEKASDEKIAVLSQKLTDESQDHDRKRNSLRDEVQAALDAAKAAATEGDNQVREFVEKRSAALSKALVESEERQTQNNAEYTRQAQSSAERYSSDLALQLRQDLLMQRSSLLESAAAQKAELEAALKKEATALRDGTASTGAQCRAEADAALSEAKKQFSTDLAEGLLSERRHAEDVRQASLNHSNALAEALRSEDAALKDEFTESTSAMRSKMREQMDDISKRSKDMFEAALSRINAAWDKLRETALTVHVLQNTVDKDVSCLQKCLTDERNLTESGFAASEQRLAQVRKGLEDLLDKSVGEVRMGLETEQRSRLEEVAGVRAETRREPLEREAADEKLSALVQRLSDAVSGQQQALEQAESNFFAGTNGARDDCSAARLEMKRHTTTLGTELTTLRAASSSLATGVLKLLQVLGLLRDEFETIAPTNGQLVLRRWGIEVDELLRWEKGGSSLAHRIEQHWHGRDATGTPSLLDIVHQKADARETEAIRAVLRDGMSPPALQKMYDCPSQASTTAPISSVSPVSPSGAVSIDGANNKMNSPLRGRRLIPEQNIVTPGADRTRPVTAPEPSKFGL